MTMHIIGPWLSSNGKKKGKVKFKNAEEAQRARQLDKDWIAMKKKWGVEAEEKKRKQAMSAEVLKYSLDIPAGRSTSHIKSLNQDNGVAVLAPAKKYTGTKVLGIGTMHKSNAVPIFSDNEAKEIASMRR
jgi:hypothetical protein